MFFSLSQLITDLENMDHEQQLQQNEAFTVVVVVVVTNLFVVNWCRVGKEV